MLKSSQHKICCNIAFPLLEAYGFAEDRASTNFIQAEALDEDGKRYTPPLNFYCKDSVTASDSIGGRFHYSLGLTSTVLFTSQNF